MVVNPVSIPGSQIVQPDKGYSNFVFSDQVGVLYHPDPNVTTPQEGFFYHVVAPPVLNNFAWNLVKLNWTRNHTGTVPEDFQALITLEGILLNGQSDLLGEVVIDTITDTAVTEDVIFDLKSNRSAPSLTKTGTGTAPAGQVQVDIPMRWFNFTSIVLKRAWLDGWSKRKAQPITAGSTDHAGAPVKVVVAYDADMNADFSDVRFVHSDGRTPLCSYLYSYTASTTATFYVYYPRSGESRNIYIQYGNATATSISNLDNVFIFADDFNDNSLDATKWEVVSGGGGSIVETNQEIRVTSDGTNRIWLKNKVSQTSPYTFEFRAKKSENIEVAWNWNGTLSGAYDLPTTGYYMQYTASPAKITLYKIVSGSQIWLDDYAITLDGNYHDYKVNCYYNGSSLIIKVYYDGTEILYSIDAGPIPSGYMGFSARETPAALNAYYDFIRVSPYSATPPAAGTVGSEESTITVNPETATEDDTSLLFTLPADWSDNSPGCLESTENGHTVYDTNDLLISARDILRHGVNATDVYMGMKLGFKLLGDNNVNAVVNSLDYAYEVV
jgi:hypothetical protein